MVVVVVVVVVDCVGKSPLEGRENDIKEEEKKKRRETWNRRGKVQASLTVSEFFYASESERKGWGGEK